MKPSTNLRRLLALGIAACSAVTPFAAASASAPERATESIDAKIESKTDPTLGLSKAPQLRLQPAAPDSRNGSDEQHGPEYQAPIDRFVPYFSPFRTDRASLSTDGRYLAYTIREAGQVSVVVVPVDHPEKAISRVAVATDATSTPMLSANQAEPTPATVRWMRWATPTRLVIDTNGAFAARGTVEWTTRTGAVFAMDADGRNARLLATPNDVREQFPNEKSLVPIDARTAHRDFWTPDKPIPAADNAAANEDDPLAGSKYTAWDPATAPGSPDAIVSSVPQDFRVYDIDPHDPRKVLLLTVGNERMSGARKIAFASLNVESGDVTDLTYDVLPGLSRGLTDRVGHLRLSLPVTLLPPFPHRYVYYGATGQSRTKPLDLTLGLNDGAGCSVSPENFFGHRTIPLGFDEDPNVFYYAANSGRDTYGVYSIDLKTGKRGAIQFENPHFDLAPMIEVFDSGNTLVIDRFQHHLAGLRYASTLNTTAWIYPSFRDVQETIERALPGHSIEIVEWDQTGNRFLVLSSAPGDAGAFYVFDRAKSQLIEFVRRAPWIDGSQTHKTYALALKTAGGMPMTGLMTVPNRPRITPMPVIMLCPDMPWQRVPAVFANRVQALADMGFVVVQISGRGAWGFGVKHRAALSNGYDLVQVEDLMSAVEFVTQNFKVDPKRIAVMGEQHGGFIALRAVQMHPETFRCAIAINAPIDLGTWLEESRWTEGASGPALTRSALGNAARITEAPLARHPELITKPIFVLHFPGPDGSLRTANYLTAKYFTEKVQSRVSQAEFADLSMDYMRSLPRARSDTYQQIENFLNVTVYDYKVKMGDAKVKPDAPKPRARRW